MKFSCYISGVFCYSWLVCLLGFWLRNTSLVKVGNPISDGIVFVLHLAWCVRGLQSLKRYWPFLIPFRAASPSLSNYCIWCFSFISNLMKSSVVYAAIYFMHVCKIWDNNLSSRFDISLQNFKQPLDIFSPQNERKRSNEYLVIILAVKQSFEWFSCLKFIFEKKQIPGSRLKTWIIESLSIIHA